AFCDILTALPPWPAFCSTKVNYQIQYQLVFCLWCLSFDALICYANEEVELLVQEKYDDPEHEDDLQFLFERLSTSIQDLSSFDEYASELKAADSSGVRCTSRARFWHENATKLNERNYELLKILVRLLETSKDSLVLCVAAHDVGEYVRHYPRGVPWQADEDKAKAETGRWRQIGAGSHRASRLLKS
uniref:V-ATPase_H_C domain-containing protein n=1 Tax=Macrostomum lignano TaxID=282301 RepID=A0A1I8FHW8_9PLAT